MMPHGVFLHLFFRVKCFATELTLESLVCHLSNTVNYNELSDKSDDTTEAVSVDLGQHQTAHLESLFINWHKRLGKE
jgi:hypothetical protein